MSNNARVNDDEIEIHQLPEVLSLQAGMMVAVDSQPTGTKSFNLTTALEGKASASDFTALENTVAEKANTSEMTTALEGKVDAPATTPAEGQVLTFNGSANTWANPPEGVYVLNYSDVTSYNDIDTERAGSQPTFIKIDSSVPLTVQVISGTTTINMENQIMQLTDYNVNNAWHVFRGYNMGSFPGNFPTADRVGSNYHFEVVLQIFRPEVTQNTKLWSVFGDYMDGRNVFNTEPQPYTVSYNNGKGGDISGKTGRSTAVQFTASNGEYRKNLLMPYEIQSHDFSTDTTPEQIQFMGWGAKSNRAGYKTIKEVPPSATGDSGKVLTVAANGTPGWGNAIGFVKNVGSLTDAATITATTLNNGFATLSTSQSALTIIDIVGTDEIVNFAIEITPSVNCTLTIQKKVGDNSPVNLKHSVAGGNALEANKTYQVTAVGTCWTLAEFEA